MSVDIRHPSRVSESEGDGTERTPEVRLPPRIRTRTMIIIGIGILGLFLLLLAVGVVSRVMNHRELVAAAQKVQTTVPEVYVIRPEPASEADLSLAATTQGIQDTIIYARTSGYLRKRYVDIGDHVTAGQLLAEIQSPEIDQQLRQAQANLQQSEKNLDLQKANLDLARVTMERYKAADAEEAVAKLTVDQNVTAHSTAQAAVAAAEATVRSNQANVQYFRDLVSFQRVLAPFNGTVIQRNVDVGALITAGSPINNTAVAPSSVTGAATGLFEIAQIDAIRVFESHRLLPGMFVYVSFKIGPSGTRWRVPSTAVIFNAQGTRVAIVGEGDKLHFQEVTLGRDFGTAIDIQQGLQGNETIVKQPTVSLQEGQVVKPIDSQDPPRH